MKFIFEPDDLRPGRMLRHRSRNTLIHDYMVVADNSIGGAARFGMIIHSEGLIVCRHMTQTELADFINMHTGYAPMDLDDPDFAEVD